MPKQTTKTPTSVTQTDGAHYRIFDHLDNIKNTNYKSYAISKYSVQGKSGQYNRPSPLTCTGYGFNIPANAVVKKITVHYRHAKRAVCTTGEGGTESPCDSNKYVGNIPAPTISLLNITGQSKKGQAPAMTGSHQTLTFTGYWNASLVNSSNFGVKIDYPTNTNNYKCYVLVGYCYIDIEYYEPQYSLSAKSANLEKVYNREEYHMSLNVSDSNTTHKNPQVNITVPAGFTYKGSSGNGTVEQTSATNLKWLPNMQSTGSGIELIFDTDVTYTTGQTVYTGTFSIGIANTSISISHDAKITKEKPREEEESGTGEPVITDEEAAPVNANVLYVEPNEEFILDFSFEDESVTSLDLYACVISTSSYGNDFSNYYLDWISEKIKVYIRSQHQWIWQKVSLYVGQDVSPLVYDLSNSLLQNKFKCEQTGEYAIVMCKHSTTDVVRVVNICVVPTLTTPNFTRLQITGEDLNRLGDGYNYTVQSDVKLTTSETYVRDWYKNFRIGVFNNRIESNCTTYFQYDNTGTEFDGYIYLPARFDLTGASLVIETDNLIYLNELNISPISPSTWTDLDYNIPIHFKKRNADNVILTLTLKDSSNNTLWTSSYHINFNADETTELEEIVVDTTDYDNLTDSEIFSNAEYWSGALSDVNTTESLQCQFTYDKDYPLFVIVTGDYPEGDQSNNDIVFDEPCIIETSDYSKRLDNGQYPVPIENLILTSDTSDVTLNAFNNTEKLLFYDLPLDEDYGTNTEMAIRGIEITGNIEQSDTLVLYANLKAQNGASRQRSIVINDYDTVVDSGNSFSIGGNGDLWGFSTLEMVNLEDWELELTISNNLEDSDASISLNDIQIILYIEKVDKQNIQWKIEDEDTAYYGVFITDRDIPEGLETDTSFLSIDGTDTNDAYRQNIREKTITVEFEIGDGCDLEASTLSLREFTKLLVNDRDEYNRPIPKKIEFNDYPDVYWEYIMEKPLDSEIEINTYKCKAKLTIPAGTAYDKENTTTSNTGYVNGIAGINPTIIVKPTNQNIVIRETVTGQEFHIGYSGEWNDKILEIDCEDRIAWLKTNEDDTDPINMNRYVDFNSDWFVLKGEYAFEGVGCVIRTVDYAERW